MLRDEKGFTLIELLIVVAIIGIIAAIAVPNLLMSVTRAKMSRTLADLRAIATALGTYMIDNDHFPIFPTVGNLSDIILLEDYTGVLKDAWGLSFQYLSGPSGKNYALRSGGADRELESHWWWNFGILLDHLDIFNSVGFRSIPCRPIPYDNRTEIIKKGCDLIFVNGQLVGSL